MKSTLRINQLIVLLLVLHLVVSPLAALAGPTIPGFYGKHADLVPPGANSLPQIQHIVDGVAGLEKVGDNRLVVRQDKEHAIVEWKSFDIGANAWTHFDQQGNANWRALNRIYDQNPSQIFGRLSADGAVYLINQNGMLFSPGARVDVSALAASALNITDADFMAGHLRFSADNYQNAAGYDSGAAAVANHGAIETTPGGMVILAAPSVANSGRIDAPFGAVLLTAGTDVAVNEKDDIFRKAMDVQVGGASEAAVNAATGSLSAEMGYVGMFGRVVNQEGLIRSVTGVRRAGTVHLQATERLLSGADSLTETPVSDSDETIVATGAFRGGQIQMISEGLIDVQGAVSAPSGTVVMDAAQRVYLDHGSSVDVSGNWAALPAEAALAIVQLNSVELKDDHAQKQGLLQGERVTFDIVEGTTIGDVSGTLVARERTALQQSTVGGRIELRSTEGEVVACSGALLDFSGGGIAYEEGIADTTRLLSGRRLYTIAGAPGTLAYDAVFGPDQPVTTTNQRFGISRTHAGGLYMGSANPLRNFSAGYLAGADAGTLEIVAPVVALNAVLDGSVQAGLHQTEAAESTDARGLLNSLGLQRPRAGTLRIGLKTGTGGVWQGRDPVVRDIRITQGESALPDDFTADAPLPASRAGLTLLAAETLNAAGVETVELNARGSISVQKDAAIQLAPGSALQLSARHIAHHGQIAIAGGTLELTLLNNATADPANSAYIAPEALGYERIFLDTGSRIDVAGQSIDQFRATGLGTPLPHPGPIAGGVVALQDQTVAGQGVFVMPGAAIDARGGWRIDHGGTVTGGDAGSISISGSAIALQGNLALHSLAGAAGGTLALHAQQLTVSATPPAAPRIALFGARDPLPATITKHLIIGDRQLDGTGAAAIELSSVLDLAVVDGATLVPSTWKLGAPNIDVKNADNWIADLPAGAGGHGAFGPEQRIRVTLDQISNASIRLRAGAPLAGDHVLPGDIVAPHQAAAVRIDTGAGVQVAPQGGITLSGPAVTVAGGLSAPAGRIALSATRSDLALTLAQGAHLSAAAYHPPTADPLGPTDLGVGHAPMAGGTIALSAAADLIVAADAILDVSGAAPAPYLRPGLDGALRLETVAGLPGELRIAFYDHLQLDGQIRAAAGSADSPGGRLTVARTDPNQAYDLHARQMHAFIDAGFDHITLASDNAIFFADSLSAAVGRKLTLDAPVIETRDQSIALRAPWVALANTSTVSSQRRAPVAAVGRLNLAGDWLDITGDVVLSGFDSVSLNAQRDIRFSDHFYQYTNITEWRGRLATAADMVINADRVYPDTQALFEITTTGDVTTRATVAAPSGQAVHSAAGRLSLAAANIQHNGRWFAPMGRLQLAATGETGRIYLAPESVLGVQGDGPLPYGRLDDDAIVWLAHDKGVGVPSEFAQSLVREAPRSGVALEGHEIVMRQGARVDLSGGGELFAYRFLPGIEGSIDPMKQPNRHVIVPGMADPMPGEAVYLAGNGLVPEGHYTLLPEAYAFLPGALVIEATGAAITHNGQAALSSGGYALSTGYTLAAGTALRTSPLTYYTVRPAEALLGEGNFTQMLMTVGDAGTFSAQARTTVLNGALLAAPLEGHIGGTIALGGETITATTAGARLPDGFFHASPMPADLAGRLLFDAAELSAGGFRAVAIGDAGTTREVLFEPGSVLQANAITVAATERIVLASGSRLAAEATADGWLRIEVPDGRLSLAPSAALHASHGMVLDTAGLDMQGEIGVTSGHLDLIGPAIRVGGQGAAGEPAGVVVDNALMQMLQGIDSVRLASRSDIRFDSDFDMRGGHLVLDAGSILLDGLAASRVTVSAGHIGLHNTLGPAIAATSDVAGTGSGTIAFEADTIEVRPGRMAGETYTASDLVIGGAGTVSLRASGDVVLAGAGALVADNDLEIGSAGLVTAVSQFSTGYDMPRLIAADVRLAAPTGTLTTRSNGNSVGSGMGYGGRVTLEGVTIDHGGQLVTPAGSVDLIATGTGGLQLGDGARIDVSGNAHAAAGAIRLTALAGAVAMAPGAVFDVSAGPQGDAGALLVSAAAPGTHIAADLRGHAQGGRGGAFALDLPAVDGFGELAAILAAGGFSGDIRLRARQSDIVVGPSDRLAASAIELVADRGGVDVRGVLDVSAAPVGGLLRIVADGDIHLHGGSVLNAAAFGPGGEGGTVEVATAQGMLRFDAGALIEVGGPAGGAPGQVGFRALRQADGVNMSLDGAVNGASWIGVEGVAVYDNTIALRTGEVPENSGVVSMDALIAEAVEWLDTLDFQNRLQGDSRERLQLFPGIELRSGGDLAVQSAIGLAQYAEQLPLGALTLRSAGDLSVNADIIDARTPVATLRQDTAVRSWGLTLVGGADLASGDPLAVLGTGGLEPGGRLATGNNALIYTEKGPVRFVSAGDTALGTMNQRSEPMTNAQMRYNIGTFAGDIDGRVGRHLEIRGGAIQTATGDIRLAVAGNLALEAVAGAGAIRTTGQAPAPEADPASSPQFLLSSYWRYAEGGSITLDVGGDLRGQTYAADAWDSSSFNRIFYHAAYGQGGARGIVTMGYGDITIRAGGRVTGAVGLFGAGDLSVAAGKGLDGRFLITAGSARLDTSENFGLLPGFDHQPIEAFDARIALTAQGSIRLGTVLNPTIANPAYRDLARWDLRYSQAGAVTLTALQGGVTLTGRTRFYNTGAGDGDRMRILPASLAIAAAGDITLGDNLHLAPAPLGQLSLTAGGDIGSTLTAPQGGYRLAMSGADPSLVYGQQEVTVARSPYNVITQSQTWATTLLHADDPAPALAQAGGSIRNVQLFIPKPSRVLAGADIIDLYYEGQHPRVDDLTCIWAGNDMRFSTGLTTTDRTGIMVGGPGQIIVAAGNDIDLGTTYGIRAVGNLTNPNLPAADMSLAVYAGLGGGFGAADPVPALALLLDETAALFGGLREQGEVYSRFLAGGDQEEALLALQQIEDELIDPFLEGRSGGGGDLNMVNSQIFTSDNTGAVYIVLGGEINVGKSTFRTAGQQAKNSGIYTTAGGHINLFADGNINVNEARLMSFLGGDITAWTREGDINAGRGSKTTIAAARPTVRIKSDGTREIIFTPPPVGSGVRALTFDPDGLEGPLSAPEPGDIFLFAPKGEIDAGEAGIAGKNIILAATKVVNVQNIEISGTSVGVPDASAAAGSLAALAGAGALSETSKLAEEQAGLGGARDRFDRYVSDLAETLVPKWIAVEVIGFGEPDAAPADEDDER